MDELEEVEESSLGNFALTTTFTDGDVVRERFFTQRGANRAKRWWVGAQKLDAEQGDIYGIVSFRIEAL